MHRNDPFAQSIPVTAFPRCAAVRIQPVKEKHEYVAAPDRGGIVPERCFRPCFPRNTFPAALMQQRGVDLQPLFPQDRKGGVMVFPLRFIKKGTCQINVHTRHPCYRFLCEIQSPRLLRRRVCSCPASRRRRRGGTPRRAQSRDILCGRPHPRKRATSYASAPMNPRRGSANTARLQRKNGTYRPVF